MYTYYTEMIVKMIFMMKRINNAWRSSRGTRDVYHPKILFEKTKTKRFLAVKLFMKEICGFLSAR